MGTFRSLRHRNYRLYFFGQIVSFTGSWMQNAAMMWLVFEATEDPLWPPLLLVAQVGPTILFGPLGGSLADRFNKARLVIFTQAAFLVTSLILLGLVAGNLAAPFVLLGFNFVNGLIQSIDLPTRLAFVPDLVPKDDLINAVSLNSLVFNSARAIGPALAGLLFLAADGAGFSHPVIAGAIACFASNALSYLAVLWALRQMKVPGDGLAATQSGALPSGSRLTRGSFFDGLRYLRSRLDLAAMLLLTGGICICGWPALTLFPAYTKLVLHLAEKEYSTLVSGLGAGALSAALLNATFGNPRRSGVFLVVGACGVVQGLRMLAAAETLHHGFLAASLLGFGLILFLSTAQSVMQLTVPDEVRGRVMAFWAMTLSASAPIGHLLAGTAAQSQSIPDVLTILAYGAGVVALGVALLAWQSKRISEGKESAEAPTEI